MQNTLERILLDRLFRFVLVLYVRDLPSLNIMATKVITLVLPIKEFDEFEQKITLIF